MLRDVGKKVLNVLVGAPPEEDRAPGGRPEQGRPPGPAPHEYPVPQPAAHIGTVYQGQSSALETLPVVPQGAPQQRSPWDQPVVGIPIESFRPKPPKATAYRPDVVADGWGVGDFVIRAASVRGFGHRYDGSPRQDDVSVAYHDGAGAVLFAVADGVSSAPLSHIGASSACRAAISAMTADLDSPDGRVDWQRLVEQAAWQLCEQARMSLGLAEVDQRAAAEQMATTLVAGLVVPTRDGPEVQVVQVGDSSAWILGPDGRYQCMLATKYREGESTYSSATMALPQVPKVRHTYGILSPGEILLVGTDGFGDPLGEGDGAVGRHFAQALRPVPPVLKFANSLDFSRETYDDDRTLFALWHRAPRNR
jgi:serine/threonine protein phosphatase PrpC